MVTANPWPASISAATAGSGASPRPAKTAASTAPAMISDGSMPSLRVTAGLTSPPITLPTAVTASSSPYPRVPTCSVWVASSTRTAWPIWLAKLKMPRRTATTRSRRCR